MNNRYKKSLMFLEKAKNIIPSAAQTYSKSYRYYSEGASPVFIDHGEGAYLWDVDGNKYLDLIMALGPVTLGYNDQQINNSISEQLKKGIVFSLPSTLEVTLAEKLVKIIPCAEKVRFVKNGSDATTAAIRLARAYTKKDIVLSCGYHGMHDWSIGVTENNLGVPDSVQDLTKTFVYNDISSLSSLIEKHKNDIAAIIMEPVRVESPKDNFLQEVRDLASRNNIVLIFDEVVTGFRMGLGGGQEYYGVTPDIAALGKGMANGMPLSAVVGKAEILEKVDLGAFISLTFGGETLSLAAALKTIEELDRRNVFNKTWALGKKFKELVNEKIKSCGVDDFIYTGGLDVMPGVFFKQRQDINNNEILALFQQELFAEGVFFLGVNYFCDAHTQQDIDLCVKAYEKGFKVLKEVYSSKKDISQLLKGKPYRPVFARNKSK